MNQAFEIAAVGLASQQKALDTIANNIANLSTPGFKRGVLKFSEVLSAPADSAHPGASLEQLSSVAGVRLETFSDIEAQGEIAHTGSPLDLAIDGKGFIELMAPGGQSLLWRGGQLTVRDGVLSTSDGLPLRSMLSVPEDASNLRINSDGSVTALLAGSGEIAELGSITLVSVDDPSRLERLDGGFYRLPDDVQVRDSVPGENGAGLLVQGGLEQSNVRLNDEMIQLMMVQRVYAANSQVVQAADQIAAMANNLKE
ncbi:MAG TPA: flagellar hook-basal body protein [Hyphomonadaceae bacterium]|jgi:flagellar basal-body rod protein FlgG|nr:flagellar hook-basal body protein [Hyphomonadaceae bacterium]